MQEWKKREQIAGVENAGVENTGAITYGKPSEEKTLRYQYCMLKRNGLRRSVNDAFITTF